MCNFRLSLAKEANLHLNHTLNLLYYANIVFKDHDISDKQKERGKGDTQKDRRRIDEFSEQLKAFPLWVMRLLVQILAGAVPTNPRSIHLVSVALRLRKEKKPTTNVLCVTGLRTLKIPRQ